MWHYDLDWNSNQIWNAPKEILPYLKEWLRIQRWAGISMIPSFILRENDEFTITQSSLTKMIGFLVDLIIEKNQSPMYTYFIPFEITKDPEFPNNFPIHLQCSDLILYLRPAELNYSFFSVLWNFLAQNSEIQSTHSNKLFFKQFNSLVTANLELNSISALGAQDTTNTLFKLTWSRDFHIVCKIFRIISKNPEIKMLKNLYYQGFRQIPQPIGCAGIELGTTSFPLLLFLEYINTTKDGGWYFWNDLNQQIESWKPRQQIHTVQLHKFGALLGKTIAEFHFYSSQISDSFFKPEPIKSADILKWKNLIKTYLQMTDTIVEEFFNKLNAEDKLISLKTNLITYLKADIWNALQNLLKIKIHQDLHLSQMLALQSSGQVFFYLIDFEGDPLLALEEKFQKDPIFRDLASIFSAFHYIKINCLIQYVKQKWNLTQEDFLKLYLNFSSFREKDKKNSDIEQLISFTKNWERLSQSIFIDNYIQQLQIHNLTFNIDFTKKNMFQTLLDLFRIERFIKELYYESRFRKEMIFIPLIGLIEVSEKFE
ncbi:MAG: hypothetical protein ACTSYB_08200 [Candidatus Helarchaeota archaeon]